MRTARSSTVCATGGGRVWSWRGMTLEEGGMALEGTALPPPHEEIDSSVKTLPSHNYCYGR